MQLDGGLPRRVRLEVGCCLCFCVAVPVATRVKLRVTLPSSICRMGLETSSRVFSSFLPLKSSKYFRAMGRNRTLVAKYLDNFLICSTHDSTTYKRVN